MVPRLKPYLSWDELWAAIHHPAEAVELFESAFARSFETAEAIAFPYGRSALWALLNALGLRDAEVVMPSYTCVVVAHAAVLSGNTPRFVDISLYDYNMDLAELEATINHQTRVVIATHLFGYPLDVDRLNDLVRQAEKRYGHRIWVVQDCAHSFGARWQGRLVCNDGDAALFGLNISKMCTSVFGGMITTRDPSLGRLIREWRDSHYRRPTILKSIQRGLYLLAVRAAFSDRGYGLVSWLQEVTPMLDRFTKAYHLDGQIHFPPDYLDRLTAVEGAVGLVQLEKYSQILERRRDNALYYGEALRDIPALELPPVVEGATYSHYVVRAHDRDRIVKAMRKKGFELGTLIDYSVPAMEAYCRYATRPSYPNADRCSAMAINLPVHADLSPLTRNALVLALQDACADIADSPSQRAALEIPPQGGTR